MAGPAMAQTRRCDVRVSSEVSMAVIGGWYEEGALQSMKKMTCKSFLHTYSLISGIANSVQ